MEVTAYDENMHQDDSNSENDRNSESSDFDISQAVHKLGFEENDSDVNHSFSGNGALLSLMLLRHLKMKDLRKSVSKNRFYVLIFFMLIANFLQKLVLEKPRSTSKFFIHTENKKVNEWISITFLGIAK